MMCDIFLGKECRSLKNKPKGKILNIIIKNKDFLFSEKCHYLVLLLGHLDGNVNQYLLPSLRKMSLVLNSVLIDVVK